MRDFRDKKCFSLFINRDFKSVIKYICFRIIFIPTILTIYVLPTKY